MFSRAAKSVVRSIGRRKYYISEQTMKTRVFQGPAVPNSTPRTRLLMQTAEKSRSLTPSTSQKIQDPRTESFPQKSQRKNSAVPSYFANRELDLERVVTELRDKDVDLASDLKKHSRTSGQHSTTEFPLSGKVTGQIWALSRIPTGTNQQVQQDSSASRWRQLGQTRSEGLPFYTSLSTQACVDAILICGDCGTKEPCDRKENPCRKKKKEENPCGKPKKQDPCHKPKRDECCEESKSEPCKDGKDFSRKGGGCGR